MRILYLLSIIYIALIISGCNPNPPRPPVVVSSAQTTITPDECRHKDPLSISLLTMGQPQQPYEILGLAKVSKYNDVGIKRQEATIRDIMRQFAASLNGDAVINIKNNDDKTITATVIAYKKSLV